MMEDPSAFETQRLILELMEDQKEQGLVVTADTLLELFGIPAEAARVVIHDFYKSAAISVLHESGFGRVVAPSSGDDQDDEGKMQTLDSEGDEMTGVVPRGAVAGSGTDEESSDTDQETEHALALMSTPSRERGYGVPDIGTLDITSKKSKDKRERPKVKESAEVKEVSLKPRPKIKMKRVDSGFVLPLGWARLKDERGIYFLNVLTQEKRRSAPPAEDEKDEKVTEEVADATVAAATESHTVDETPLGSFRRVVSDGAVGMQSKKRTPKLVQSKSHGDMRGVSATPSGHDADDSNSHEESVSLERGVDVAVPMSASDLKPSAESESFVDYPALPDEDDVRSRMSSLPDATATRIRCERLWEELIDKIVDGMNLGTQLGALKSLKAISKNLLKTEFDAKSHHRVLYLANPVLHEKVTRHCGGFEFLTELGFVPIDDNRLAVLTPDYDKIRAAIAVVNGRLELLHGQRPSSLMDSGRMKSLFGSTMVAALDPFKVSLALQIEKTTLESAALPAADGFVPRGDVIVMSLTQRSSMRTFEGVFTKEDLIKQNFHPLTAVKTDLETIQAAFYGNRDNITLECGFVKSDDARLKMKRKFFDGASLLVVVKEVIGKHVFPYKFVLKRKPKSSSDCHVQMSSV